ncbi:hypothetical protein [uncultured Gimesia sp.]|uniref:hypothetical protein n=1 Tax=uncultured Gimesia sp. TaxID=1678688 RepID=UPI00260C8EED|nr:hypothetical protein [uncultured Gimesia sp.]
MTAPKKGSRRIIVDEATYVWRVPRRPSSGSFDGNSGYTVTVQLADRSGSTLAIVVAQKHPTLAQLWGEPANPILPSHVAAAIRRAISRGWEPSDRNSLFAESLDFSDKSIVPEDNTETR